MAKKPFILIAEDDPDGRLIYEKVIEKTDFEVDHQFVGSGPELLSFLGDDSRPRPSLVFMGFQLPADGHLALEDMMKDERTRSIPVIVITSEEDESESRKAYGACANSYIIKPGRFQDFVDTLNQVFSYWFKTVKVVS
ncbi:MAG: hypothetical protein CVU57_04160 [Deltaproteobacteria bacterium HGW-Deltaproteobacteria-15]|nr:MAG: hypothetical protein CVU57_04160 [Deltaproteobacteria bacterium HGW-Deltaproteobacteria-15]